MAQLGADGQPAHPAFAAHFTDPLYTDATGEFAPFGTDEGADLLGSWAPRADELDPTSTVRDLLEGELGQPSDVDELVAGLRSTASEDDDPGSAGGRPRSADGADDDDEADERLSDEPDGGDAVDAAAIVLGAGFTLLRLTGTIDPEGHQLVLRALDALESFYGEQDELTTMRSDLESFS